MVSSTDAIKKRQNIATLSIQEARKLVLGSQKVLSKASTGYALASTLSAIEHLGYIQIDTISVVQRAHHHTLWSRNPLYKTDHLELLMQQKKVFEYWSHAAAYLPMRDFKYSLVRKQAFIEGKEIRWYKGDEALLKSVLERITKEGPLMAKDFDNKDRKEGQWTIKPSKHALEYLFMQGKIMISHRQNFHKVYDLTERVLPADTDLNIPCEEEYAKFLIQSYLNSNGIGLASEMAYLLKNTKALINRTLKIMVSNGELLQIKINEQVYFALAKTLELLNEPIDLNQVKILSPFDNLLIQRKRMLNLFEFDYMLECYVSEAKRKFGYFALPVLWEGRFVARMDCKADRKTGQFLIKHLVLEDKISNIESFLKALSLELIPFLKFNNCKTICLHKTTPTHIKPLLEKAIEAVIL